jgi:hypothetical protein
MSLLTGGIDLTKNIKTKKNIFYLLLASLITAFITQSFLRAEKVDQTPTFIIPKNYQSIKIPSILFTEFHSGKIVSIFDQQKNILAKEAYLIENSSSYEDQFINQEHEAISYQLITVAIPEKHTEIVFKNKSQYFYITPYTPNPRELTSSKKNKGNNYEIKY